MRTKADIFQGENEKLFLMRCRMDFGFFYTRVMGRILKPFHQEWVDILKKYDRIAIAAPTGFGKCFSELTEIMLFDGSFKYAKDIEASDILMGDDSKPRTVSSTVVGEEEMYEIQQNNGDNYTVNESHILSLRMNSNAGWKKKGEIVDISVNEYLNKSKTFRHCAKGFKVPVDFESKDVKIDPYFLGLWLGDGRSNEPSITNVDEEIIEFLEDYSKSLGLRLSVYDYKDRCNSYSIVGSKNVKNPITERLRDYDLINNKHVPKDYKINSKEVRLSVLAGLIDSDGYVKKNTISIAQKRKVIADDIVFLSRSVGLAATIRKKTKKIKSTGFEGEYYEVIISGDTDMIPTKIPRKQCSKRKINKNALNTGIKVINKGVGKYYGFELDGSNKRFLLKDFTVTHNTEMFGVGYCIYQSFFFPESLSIIVANTIRTQSAKILADIKLEIGNNELLKSLKPKDSSTTWTTEKIVTSNGSVILYSSNSPNIRGNQANYVFADEVAVYDDHEVFIRDVASRVTNKKGKLAAVSTPVNTSDLLAQLMNKEGYFSKFYPALLDDDGNPDEHGESIWPDKYSKDYLRAEIKNTSLSSFQKNYMVNPRAESESPFYSLTAVEDCYDVTRSFTTKTEGGQVYIGCDFAYGDGHYADFDAYTVCEYINERIIIRRADRYKGLPVEEKVRKITELVEIYRPDMIVVDPNNVAQGFLKDLYRLGFPIQEQSFQSIARRKMLIELKQLIERKMVVIPRGDDDMGSTITYTDKLTEELISFRDQQSKLTHTNQLVSHAAHDDTVMSLAMACKGSQYFDNCMEDHIACGN